MTARRELIRRLSEDSLGGIATLHDVTDAEGLLDAYRAEVLREEADEIVAYCPDHTNGDEAWMDCHCAVADEMRRRANKTTEVTS